MRCSSSKMIALVALLTAWAILGSGSQARAGFASSAVLCSPRVSPLGAGSLLDGPSPEEANGATVSYFVSFDGDTEGDGWQDQTSPLWQFFRMFFPSEPSRQVGGGASGTGTTWRDRTTRQQDVPPASLPDSAPPGVKSCLLMENEGSPPNGLSLGLFRPPRA